MPYTLEEGSQLDYGTHSRPRFRFQHLWRYYCCLTLSTRPFTQLDQWIFSDQMLADRGGLVIMSDKDVNGFLENEWRSCDGVNG